MGQAAQTGRASRRRDHLQHNAGGYESGRTLVLWIAGFAGLLIVLSLALTWVDSTNLNDIDGYRSAGLTDLPDANSGVEQLLEFAAGQGLDCPSAQALAAGLSDCSTVLEISRTINDHDTASAVIWGLMILGTIALLFPLTRFTYQANANLRHLRLTGQRFTPGWAAGWFFIPFANFIQPARVYRELVRASGSTETSGAPTWQNTSPPDVQIVGFWWPLVVIAIFFGPSGISLFVSHGDIDGWSQAAQMLVWADLFQVFPLALTVVVVYRLQRAQEIRRQLVRAGQTPRSEDS
ncbi:MAG: DUF4328 domain-containing protein [Chloroflexi bacterium]|nr:DUF4328 domain-containing protein [Chloroflexota bacterium]